VRHIRDKIESAVSVEKLAVERLGWGGVGIARSESGKLVLLSAPLALFPGEVVEARVVWRGRHGEGAVTRWIARDARRAGAGCAYASRCGGCALWEAGEFAGELKRMMVDDLLRRELRIGAAAKPNADGESSASDNAVDNADSQSSTFSAENLLWLPAPDTALRARIQLHYDGHSVGYYERASRTIVEIDECPVALPEVSRAIVQIRRLFAGAVKLDADSDIGKSILRLRNAKHRGFDVDVRIELAAGTPADKVYAVITGALLRRPERDSDRSPRGVYRGGRRESPHRDEAARRIDQVVLVIDGEQVREVTEDEHSIAHRLGGTAIWHPVGGFFQVCPNWSYEAFERVFDEWDVSGDTLYDLYGGCGYFSVLLRKRFKRFVVVDSDETATDHAAVNMATQDCLTETSDISKWLERIANRAGKSETVSDIVGARRILRPKAVIDPPTANDVIIFDPPRAGLPEVAVRALTARDARGAPAIRARAVILVGCDGAIFTRDLRKLTPAFELTRLAAIDLFPMTQNVEFVGMLSRKTV